MNSAILANRSAAATASVEGTLLKQLWHSTRITIETLLSMRRLLQRFDDMQGLLREARVCETSNPQRSSALRAKAFELLS